MITLTVKEITELHGKLVAATGGSAGLRDRSLLESSVFSAESVFGGTEAYPTIEEKASRLMFSLTNNHAFVDGNKRIGVLVLLLTLNINGIKLDYTQDELTELGLTTADGSCDYESILNWVKKHKV